MYSILALVFLSSTLFNAISVTGFSILPAKQKETEVFSGMIGTVADCAAGKSAYTLDSAGYWPDPPIIGENATLSFLYTVPSGYPDVSDGSAVYSISLNGIPFPSSTDPLCDDVPCPITEGQHNLTSTNIWDGGVSGKVVSKIQWYDSQKTLLLCVQVTLRVGQVCKGMLRFLPICS